MACMLIAVTTKGAQIFQSTEEGEEGKEQGDFVDYGWANIGSFDDLDRIFRYTCNYSLNSLIEDY